MDVYIAVAVADRCENLGEIADSDTLGASRHDIRRTNGACDLAVLGLRTDGYGPALRGIARRAADPVHHRAICEALAEVDVGLGGRSAQTGVREFVRQLGIVILQRR